MRGIIFAALVLVSVGVESRPFMDSLPPDSTRLSAKLSDAQPNGHGKSASFPDVSGGASQPRDFDESTEVAKKDKDHS